MNDINLEPGVTVAISKDQFDRLLTRLREMGYQTIGPRTGDGAIVYAPIEGLADLPKGYTSEQSAGKYRLVYSGHERYFDVTPGAQSWKSFFFPPRLLMFSMQRENSRWETTTHTASQEEVPMLALIGVRPCELAAIQIQDRVFLQNGWSDPYYRARRHSAFILAVNCLHPCGTCFCASMGTGPGVDEGFDLSLTELEDSFLVKVGSEAGRLALSGLKVKPASAFLLQSAQRGLQEARQNMGRELSDLDELPEQLLGALEHPHWEKVAARCMSCASCTQVCPTCFCWAPLDHLDITGNTGSRTRVWDSCFNPNYSYISGGNTRPNTMARYRQWLTHKFASWQRQYGTLGCVGCGRCITWCPVGIDVTEEIAAVRKDTSA